MQYRKDRKGNDLSVLGYGCMRFTRKGSGIDLEKAEKELMYAIRSGVNYLDTAYIYPGSEAAVGEILHRNHCRENVYIATKLPHYMIKSVEGAEKVFQEELRRLQTDYIDYYLMHMLTDVDTWEKLKKAGIMEWIESKLKSGAIRNIGFSYHGHTEMFQRLVDSYDWDFCQIQYNYMDEHSQAGRRGLKYAHEKGLPVIIMEPLRGGRLVQGLPQSAARILENEEPRRSPAEWGLRWLWDQPEVTVVLSGMNDAAQVEENVRIAREAEVGCMTERDREVIEKVKAEINRYIKVPCTGCGYCMPCPVGVDIPGCFAAYNMRYTDSWYQGMKAYMMCTTLRMNPSNASKCLRCGKCEQHCPQNISIRESLQNVKKHMETPPYHIARVISKRIGKY